MKYLLFVLIFLVFASCSEHSNFTNAKYNSPEQGGYVKVNYDEQETGPGLVLIKGGYFELYNNERTKEVLIPSFYMDQTEVSNQAWVDYMHWTKRTFTDFPLVHTATFPSTKVWLENGAYNEPMVDYYLNHPAYSNYPVVGVSWLQANNYCKWRTDRVNEYILIREGVLSWNNDQQNEPFTTSAYLATQYTNGTVKKYKLEYYKPPRGNGYYLRSEIENQITMQQGILLPKYRLPTSSEWDYAASISTTKKGVIYPWNGKVHKNKKLNQSLNPKLNGQISPLTSINAYWPNDYGLYCMRSNVSEWVMDSYVENGEVSNYSPFSGENVILTQKLNSEGNPSEKLDEVLYDIKGIIEYSKNLFKQRRKKHGGVITDSLDFLFIQEIDSLLKKCLYTFNNIGELEASRQMRDIIESYIPDIGFRIQSYPGLEDFQYEIINNYLEGIAAFIRFTPGDIVYRSIKPKDLTLNSYKLTPEMIKFIPSLQFDLDKNINTENRIFKGRNWRDTTEITHARYLNKYLSSSVIGFRCAMDRLGPVKK